MASFFSVIIPVYNRAELLRRALDSLAAQRFRDFEVIVVDDGSTDGSGEAAAQSELNPRVVRQENAGPGPARNLGVREATGEYVAFLDSDDVWFPWTLEKYREAIAQHDQPPCLFGCVRRFSDAAELDAISEMPLRTTRYDDYLATGADNEVFQGTGVAALRRDTVLANGGFHSKRVYCEDLDFLLRMGTTGPVVHVQAPAMIGLHVHAASSMSDLQRTYEGTALLLRQEKCGNYPGGVPRRAERRALLLKHTVSVLQTCIVKGESGFAWQLYRRIAPWLLARGEAPVCLDLAKSIARNIYRSNIRAKR